MELTKAAVRQDPIALAKDKMAKEAALHLALSTPVGIAKLAAVLGAPVKMYLDYMAIGRKLVIVQPMAQGQPAFYDRDIPEWYGSVVGKDGTSLLIICRGTRTFLDWFEIVSQPRIPYGEVKHRLYAVVDRTKERLKQSLMLREDYRWLALFDTAALASGHIVNTGAPIIKSDLADLFNFIEARQSATDIGRNFVQNIVMNSHSTTEIRKWNFNVVDEIARVELRKTGFLSRIFSANIYITDIYGLNSDGSTYVYALAEPEKVGWMPMWADSEVHPADRPEDVLLGFTGYENLCMAILNNHCVSRLGHTP